MKSEDDQEQQTSNTLRLFGLLAYAVEEAEKLGFEKTSIELRRAGLQLCFETGGDTRLEDAFRSSTAGHG